MSFPVRPACFSANPIRQFFYSLAGSPSHIGLSMCQPMDELERRGFISPGKHQTFAIFCRQIAALKALHEESHPACSGDGVDAIVVAVPVGFHDELGIPDSQVGAETGGGLVFRAVHPDLPARMGAARQGNPSSLGALQVAARGSIRPFRGDRTGVPHNTCRISERARGSDPPWKLRTGSDWYSSLLMKVIRPALPLRCIFSDCGSTSRTTLCSFAPALFTLSQSAAP